MNRIHRTNQRNSERRSLALALLVLLVCLCLPDVQARAESLSVRASASKVRIGDTVTVSVTVPAGVSATVNVTYPKSVFSFEAASETASANGGTVSMTLGGYGGSSEATTGTITFVAESAGSATFSASAPVAGNEEGDRVSLGSASASVTVQNEAGGSAGREDGDDDDGDDGDDDGDDDDDDEDDDDGDDGDDGDGDSSGGGSGEGGSTRKSPDNSLASLTLSAGSLSPAFRYNVVNYTATVDNSVTSVAVSARASNAKATVESVKGGDNLKVGENTIQIVVKAENGVTATYTVIVTRKAKEEEPDEPEEPGDADEPEEPEEPDEPDEPGDADEPEEPDEPDEPGRQSFLVNGKELYPQALPQGTAESGFEQTEISLWGQTYQALVDTFASGNLTLVCLADENGENAGLRLLLSGNLQEAYDYVRLGSEKGFIILLPDGNGNVPSAYAAMPTSLRIEDYGTVDAWFEKSGDTQALVYAVNQRGAQDWYMLDIDTLSYVRYQEKSAPQEISGPDTQKNEPKEQPRTDASEVQKLKKQNHLIIGIAAIVVLVLLIILILVVVAVRGDGGLEDEDEIEDEDEEPGDDLSEEPGGFAEPEEPQTEEKPAKPAKRYDKSIFDSYYLTDVFRDDGDMEEEDADDSGYEKAADADDSGYAPDADDSGYAPDAGEPARAGAPMKKDTPVRADAAVQKDTPVHAGAASQKDMDDFLPENGRLREASDEPQAGMRPGSVQVDIADIADPAPMQTVRTHRDKDDVDLEFIDL